MIFKQALSVVVSLSLLANQTLYAASLELDKKVSQKTTLDVAANGVPIVNIATPNVNGLSHNKFTNYNVESTGLILNNATDIVQTKLGGFIDANPNLTTGAKVILNEVTGTHRSLLNGYTEVAGYAADVIIANPNGISINGGGFINTSHVTLSTGNPELLNGRINGFDVAGGDILIHGDGLDASNLSQVELYAKTVALNAKLHAQTLNMVTGENHILRDGTITSKQKTGTGVSLDSSVLGGIYANTITLIGTDKGVGVNLPPEILASNGEITIQADGKVSLQNVTAAKEITVHSSSNDIVLNGNINSFSSIDLHAKNDIINNATLTAGLYEDGTYNPLTLVTLQSDGMVNNGQLTSYGTASFTTKALENQGAIHAVKTLHVKTDDLHSSGTLFSLSDVILETHHSFFNEGIIQSATLDLRTNTLSNTGNINASDLVVYATSLNNEGIFYTTDALNIQGGSLTNAGTIFSDNALNITTDTTLGNEGLLNGA